MLNLETIGMCGNGDEILFFSNLKFNYRKIITINTLLDLKTIGMCGRRHD